MSMRMLLGYDPKDTKKRPGSASSLQSENMNLYKTKYSVPMSRVKRLPPIREEGGTPAHSPRKTVQGKPSPRDIFVSSQSQTFVKSRAPPQERPVSRVLPIPREPDRLSPENYKPPKKPVQIYDPMQPLSPLDINHTMVDGLVADYLHYARYGHIIPVYEGTSSLNCPCCTVRNRQNVRTLLGFQNVASPEDKPRKYDRHSYLTHPEHETEEELKSYDRMFPNSLYAKIPKKREPSQTEKKMQHLAEQSQKQSWMAYQPLPYATNYLNPEFNRPSEVKSFYDNQPPASYSYISGKVLDANTRFDSAMNRLEKLSFGSSSYVD